MPSRDEELAPLIRGVFLPEDGQIGPSPTHATGIPLGRAQPSTVCRAPEAAEVYRNNPDADFHALVAE